MQRRLLTTHSTKDERFEITWTAGPDGLTYTGPPATHVPAVKVKPAAVAGQLIVGATFSRSAAVKDPDAVERRYYLRVQRGADTRLELLTADEEWTRFGAPLHAWVPISVGTSLQVSFSR